MVQDSDVSIRELPRRSVLGNLVLMELYYSFKWCGEGRVRTSDARTTTGVTGFKKPVALNHSATSP